MTDPFRGYLGDYLVPGDLTGDIKAQINEGALIVHYSGHGSIQLLTGESVFGNADVADLTNEDKYPFFISMSCLSGYFGYPEGWLDVPSLAQVLLRSDAKGAVAALMPTGMTTTGGQHILTQALFDALFTEDTRILGEAISLAKQTLLANGGDFSETSETFLLFGDPATELKIPLPRRPRAVSAQSSTGGVRISWNVATDCNGGSVSGYNLYRSTSPGGEYTRVNNTRITATQYDDTSTEGGTTYTYVVTSVDTDSLESVQSQQASATAGFTASSTSGCFISTAAGHCRWE